MARIDDVWFPAKSDCRWLWDLPTCWQGWTVVIGWWLALIAGVIYLPTIADPTIALPAYILGMSVLLASICYLKGEKLHFWD